MSLLFAPVLATPLLKIPLLFAGAISTHIGITPANPPASVHERKEYAREISSGASTWPIICSTMKYFVWANAFSEAAVLLAHHAPALFPSHILSFLTSNPACASNIRVTPIFLAGCTITCLGGFFRLWSYNALGRLYTWELTVRDGHKLVTTGPYAWVRHPGYLGITLLSIGNLLTWFGPGSWWTEYDFLASIGGTTVGVAFGAFWITISAMLLKRAEREDAVLSKEFGSDWLAWAKRTPYKVIPFIY